MAVPFKTRLEVCMFEQIRQAIAAVLTQLGLEEFRINLQRPPNPNLGDLALNLAAYVKHDNIPLTTLSNGIMEALKQLSEVASVTACGAYLNMVITPQALFSQAVQTACDRNALIQATRKVMVEYISPNTNKPLHLGHVRNGVLGAAVANILEAVGHQVIRAILINDRGVHICKSMLAYQRWGDGATPESSSKKGDHFVGDWYVRYAQEAKADPLLKQAASEMLRKWEDGDTETIELWAQMNQWAYQGFDETCELYGFRFDCRYYESELYLLGKDMVLGGVRQGVFQQIGDNSIVFWLDPDAFGRNPDQTLKWATLLRADGTSIYITQDLATAVEKAETYNLDASIYVVGNEQEHHFRVLFTMLRSLGYAWAENLHHLSYGMVELPDGKMKSREGNVVDADDLVFQMTELAREVIRGCDTGSAVAEEAEQIANIVALAAIKFYLLRTDPKARIKFDPAKSLAFEGDTGPYVLYAKVRTSSLLRRGQAQGLAPATELGQLGNSEERLLAFSIIELPGVVRKAARGYNPALVADHLLKIARYFHAFYGGTQVLGPDKELSQQRLALVEATGNALEWGLDLLGIKSLEVM